MWRSAKTCLPIVCTVMLSGCTGFGVFLDHTDQWFSRNPNMPAGSSETFMTIRGEKVDVPPLLPQTGNVWPAAEPAQPTLADLTQQDQDLRKLGANGPGPAGAANANPQVNRANAADKGLPPPRRQPPPGHMPAVTQTPNGPAMDTSGGSAKGYKDLQGGTAGKGILIPNGNGTSTLIGPDGNVTTVPTKP